MGKADKPEKSNKKQRHFWKDFKAELKKVIWPTRSQVIKNTIVVLVIVAIVTALCFVLDLVFEAMNTYGIDKLKTMVQNSVSDTTDEENSTSDDENTIDEETADDGTESEETSSDDAYVFEVDTTEDSTETTDDSGVQVFEFNFTDDDTETSEDTGAETTEDTSASSENE